MGAQGDADKLHEQLKLQEEHVLAGRSGLEVVFEVLLKSKYPLTTRVAQEKLGSGEIWTVDGGSLIVVVDEGIALAEMRSLATRDPKPATVVILDRCLTDSLKANARKIFEDASVEFKTI